MSTAPATQPDWTTFYAEAVAAARDFIDHGVPVVICTPNPAWTPDPACKVPDVKHPSGWATITADQCDLSAFRPGVDTLAMVSGHGVDVVDVDPKNGGSLDNLPPFRRFGLHTTPSGGRHAFVRSTGIGKMSLTTSEGPVGDYCGGTVDGGSRMLCYLPGSSRPKYAAHPPYEILERIDLDVLFEHEPDDELLAALIGAGGNFAGEAGQRAATRGEMQAFRAEHSEPPQAANQCRYGRQTMSAIIAEGLATTVGRHAWAVRAACRAVELCRTGCATAADVDALEDVLNTIKPEGGSHWPSILAWAVTNATGQADCGLHGPNATPRRDRLDGPDPGAPTSQPPAVPGADATQSGFDIEREPFWNSRPELVHIRQYARARRAAPWAVLGCVLARVVGRIEPCVTLPPFVGSEASLNLFVGLVGTSGTGKGAAEGAAKSAIVYNVNGLSGVALEEVNVGSGEGIVHTFQKFVPGKGDLPGEVKSIETRALFRSAEVDTLAALKGRQGSTLLPRLRDAWNGDALGFGYADQTRRLNLPEHAYRLCLIVGIQPRRAGVLLDDSDGGTPQRFLWLPTRDVDVPDTRPDTPEPYPWTHPWAGMDNQPTRMHMTVCDAAFDAIDRASVARHRGDVGALDGHALLCRLKVAAALAILHGGLEVTEEDWQLAGDVMAVSDHTRTSIVHELSSRHEDIARARGRSDAIRAEAAEEVRSDAAVKRVAKAIVRGLTETWQPRAAVRKRLPGRDRGHFDSAIQRLISSGIVEAEDGRYRGQDGLRYRLATGSRS